jgi:hypothetical protein
MNVEHTKLIRVPLQAIGANDLFWGQYFNDHVIDLFDTAIAGTTSVDVTSASVTLTDIPGQADQARASIIRAFGSPTPGVNEFREVVLPSRNHLYFCFNNTSTQVQVAFKTTSTDGVWLDGITGQTACVLVSEDGLACDGMIVKSPNTTTDYATRDEGHLARGALVNTTPQTYVSITYFREGNFATFEIHTVQTSNFTTGGFTIDCSGVEPLIPDDYWPNRAVSTRVAVLETATVYPAILRILPEPRRITITKADGTAWNAGAMRRIYGGMTFSFPVIF